MKEYPEINKILKKMKNLIVLLFIGLKAKKKSY